MDETRISYLNIIRKRHRINGLAVALQTYGMAVGRTFSDTSKNPWWVERFYDSPRVVQSTLRRMAGNEQSGKIWDAAVSEAEPVQFYKERLFRT